MDAKSREKITRILVNELYSADQGRDETRVVFLAAREIDSPTGEMCTFSIFLPMGSSGAKRVAGKVPSQKAYNPSATPRVTPRLAVGSLYMAL